MSKLHIICRLCTLEQALQKATDEITVLKELLYALESSHLTDAKTCTDLVKELENYKSLTSVHPSTATDPSSILKYTADEGFEITKRKLNIIISGLPEANNDVEDFLFFANTYHNLPAALTSDDIKHTERLGRASTPVSYTHLTLPTIYSV